MYTTKQDAIDQAITPALGEYAADHDVDAIFDQAFEYSADLGGFVQTVDTDGFWTIVEGARR